MPTIEQNTTEKRDEIELKKRKKAEIAEYTRRRNLSIPLPLSVFLLGYLVRHLP